MAPDIITSAWPPPGFCDYWRTVRMFFGEVYLQAVVTRLLEVGVVDGMAV
jgi:hypothetical protein